MTCLRTTSRVVAALFIVPALTACSEDAPPEQAEIVRPVRAIEVTDIGDLHRRYFIGTARAAREVSLAFAVPGTVSNVSVAVGDEVAQGQVVATLDSATYQAEVDRLTADLESAVASYENARDQTARQKALLDKGHVSQAAVDRFVAGERSAEAAIKSVQGALDKATLNLSYTHLKSPFAGEVVAKYVENFEEVQAQKAVLRILDNERIEMVIDIPERYIALARHVIDIKVTFDAIGDVPIPAEMTEIGTEASVTTRTFPVTLAMEQPDGVRVLPGMTGRARGRLKDGYDPYSGIVVPPAAVFVPEGQEKPHVWVVDRSTMTVSQRAVELSLPRSEGLSIESGIDVGDIVVTAGANSLRAGQKVSLLETEQPG